MNGTDIETGRKKKIVNVTRRVDLRKLFSMVTLGRKSTVYFCLHTKRVFWVLGNHKKQESNKFTFDTDLSNFLCFSHKMEENLLLGGWCFVSTDHTHQNFFCEMKFFVFFFLCRHWLENLKKGKTNYLKVFFLKKTSTQPCKNRPKKD